MKIHNDLEKFIALKPAEYRLLKSISFTRDVNSQGNGYEVELVLTKIQRHESDCLKLWCVNVFYIRLGDIESLFGMLLSIEDVSDRQLEGISYRISEEENGTFSFFCKEFFVKILKED